MKEKKYPTPYNLEEFFRAVDELKESVESGKYFCVQEKDVANGHIYLNARKKDGQVKAAEDVTIEFYLFYDDGDEIVKTEKTVSEFFEHSSELFGCGASEDGWGHDYIKKLEEFRAAIDGEIDKMKQSIEEIEK